jgi:hypothetical protein
MTRSLEEVVRTGQIVIGGLMAGLVFFSVVIVITKLTSDMSGDPQLENLLLAVLAVMGVGCAAGYAVVRGALVKELRGRAAELRQVEDPASRVVDAYQLFVVRGGGLIEGPGFFALVTHLVSGSVAALAGAALALICLGLHFPTVAKIRRIVDDAIRP